MKFQHSTSTGKTGGIDAELMRKRLIRFYELTDKLQGEFGEMSDRVGMKPNSKSKKHPYTTPDGHKITKGEQDIINRMGFVQVAYNKRQDLAEWNGLYDLIAGQVLEMAETAMSAYLRKHRRQVFDDNNRDDIIQFIAVALMRFSVFKYDPHQPTNPAVYLYKMATMALYEYFRRTATGKRMEESVVMRALNDAIVNEKLPDIDAELVIGQQNSGKVGCSDDSDGME